MKTFALAAAVTAVFITLLISPAQAAPRADEAKTIVKTFAQTLQGELKAALKAGGPTQAVDVCHERAPAIAAEVAGDRRQRRGWRAAFRARPRMPGPWRPSPSTTRQPITSPP